MQKQIDYYVYEGDMARMERINRRMMILSIILFVAVVVSNIAWYILK